MPDDSLRRLSRRFEFGVHDGVPEHPQPMYQEHTYGRTPPRYTGQASDVSSPAPEGVVAAVFLVKDGEVIGVSGDPEGQDAKTAIARGKLR